MNSGPCSPNGIARELPVNRYIISTTDCSGRITSVNEAFAEISRYQPEELLGNPHSIVRHPDMPQTIFWLAWDALLADEDFFGYVKNLSKDGSHYWVFAHMRPEHDSEGTIKGFRSVRRRAAPQAIAKITHLYTQMREAERAADTGQAIEAGLRVLRAHLAQAGQNYEHFIAALAGKDAAGKCG